MPGYCEFCLTATAAGSPWCQACYRGLAWNHTACYQCAEPLGPNISVGTSSFRRRCGHCLLSAPQFDTADVPLLYQGAVGALLKAFKFQASPRAGNLLLELFLSGRKEGGLPDALLPVPLHMSRARERGFNQAVWLTEKLAGEYRLPLIHAERLHSTQSQRAFNRRQRFKNLQGAFYLEAPLPLHVTIVDDVMTTGATVNALAAAAKQAGAERVDVWAIARTPLQQA
ncbi:ComF family protein [Halomonas sp. ZH2S]|uniref:ComF family protein n=1 Tax=Vreelandella zhuhanensis TaxID=2684210 RepID=A0A7X3GXV3_9GAMM|nr:ComF family protein [Halomonas zhuhanensis]